MKQDEMAELGAALAGITHDLNNVLATVKEASGLGLDVLKTGGGPSSNEERLGKALTRIENQVTRGTVIVSQLNRFAHRLDEPGQRAAACEVLEHLAFLKGRGARLRQVRLVQAATDERLQLEAPVFRLCLALSAGIECCLKHAQPDDEVVINARPEEGGVTFEIALHRDAVPVPTPWADDELLPWQETVASYGARLELEADARGLRLSLSG